MPQDQTTKKTYIDVALIDVRAIELYNCIAQGQGDKVFKVIEDNGGKIPVLPKPNLPPLFLAIKLRQRAIARILLQYGANPNEIIPDPSDSYGDRYIDPFCMASDLKDESLMVLLIESEYLEKDEATLTYILCNAVKLQFVDLVAVLLRRGVDIKKIHDGRTIMQIAAKIGNVTIIEQLVTHKAAIDETTMSESKTPMLIAAENGHVIAVKTLLSHGANVQARNTLGQTVCDLLKIAIYTAKASQEHSKAKELYDLFEYILNNYFRSDYGLRLLCASYEGSPNMVKIDSLSDKRENTDGKVTTLTKP